MASEETLLADSDAGERHAKNTLLSSLLSYMPGQEVHHHLTDAKDAIPQDAPIR